MKLFLKNNFFKKITKWTLYWNGIALVETYESLSPV